MNEYFFQMMWSYVNLFLIETVSLKTLGNQQNGN